MVKKSAQRWDSGWIFRRMGDIQRSLAKEITAHLEESYGKTFWVTLCYSPGTACKRWGLYRLEKDDYMSVGHFAFEDVKGLLSKARELATGGKVVPISQVKR